MTCEDYREQLQKFLDKRVQIALPEELSRHVVNCAECRAAWSDFHAIHEALNKIHPIPLPQKLSQSLYAIPTRESAWSAIASVIDTSVRRYYLALVALLLYIGASSIFPQFRSYFDIGFLTFGLSTAFSGLLKRRIVGLQTPATR